MSDLRVWAGIHPTGAWSEPSRPRIDKHPLQVKLRWEMSA